MSSGLMSLVAALGILAVAAVVFARPGREPGAWPLAALCAIGFAWHLGDFLFATAELREARVLSAVGAALIVPTFVQFLRTVLGRPIGAGVVALHVIGGLFALVTAGGAWSGALYEVVISPTWSIAYVVVFIPPSAVAIFAVARSALGPAAPERVRARGLFLGASVGLLGGLTDLAMQSGLTLPALGAVGSIASALFFAWVLDTGVEADRALPTRSALLVVATTAAAAYVTASVASLEGGRVEAVAAAGGGTALVGLAVFRYAAARMEREALRMRSLALLGTFAAEVAHEVRNPLAAIRGEIDLAALDLPEGSAVRDALARIDREVERLDRIVTDYHALARDRSQHAERAEIGELLREMVRLYRHLVPQDVTFRLEVPDSPITVTADPPRLRQAILNLMRNSVAAMPEGGTLTLRATPCEVSGSSERRVRIEVVDTGRGISARERKRVLEPFHTTRPDGSGLGLAIVERIAREHGGSLELRSEIGRGSVFSLTIPMEAP
ncbi:MAG: hypothetical protein IT379_05525 [Deltaproteobacteria bacterium]|nr:hypothetical protein [Deltaproteobacteria bacterium]